MTATAFKPQSPRHYCPASGQWAISRFTEAGGVTYAVCDRCAGAPIRVVRGAAGVGWIFTQHHQREAMR